MDTEDAVLTVPEAAKLLRLSRTFTYQLVAEGELPCLRFGRRVLVPRAALEQFISEHALSSGTNASSA
jgi:excisionase family DNA binding protein